MKRILSIDSTCDISLESLKKYKINSMPIHINLNGKEYQDGADIDSDFIYKIYYKKGVLPKTSAVSQSEYKEYFENLKKSNNANEIIHISLSSAISTTYQNALNASKKLNGVCVVDSKNLSFGSGILALEALKKIKDKKINSLKKIFDELNSIKKNIDMSFLLSTLDFISTGGRCPNIVALGVNFLNIKPCIKIDNKQGKMSISKIYRGKLEFVLPKYINEKLKNKSLKNSEIFIVHSGVEDELLNLTSDLIKKENKDYNIEVIRAGCTITSHCGPGTIGLAFIRK